MRLRNPVYHVEGSIRVSTCVLDSDVFNSVRNFFDDENSTLPSTEIPNDFAVSIRSSIECISRPAYVRKLFMRLDEFVMESLRAWNEPLFKGTAREQFMLYKVGSDCKKHVDDQFKPASSVGKTKYGMHLLNQVAGILYVSSPDLEGGEIVFPNQNIVVPSTTGTLVCFPSNMDYPHYVNPVTRGDRIAIARHYFVQDTPAV